MRAWDMCVNVAIRKPAAQSSLSQWSTELGAGGAVTGVMPPQFGFHTARETNPWWMVDLQHPYPIERIVVHNRLDSCGERARTCKVEMSENGQSWRLVHAGLAFFSGGPVGPPLTLHLGCRFSARYVRISLDETEMLHLAQVEVYAHVGNRVKERYGLRNISFRGDYSTERSAYKNRHNLAYTIEGGEVVDYGFSLIGVRPTAFGRLGNQIIQLINATIIARRLHLKYVIVTNAGLIEIGESFEQNGVAYVAGIEPGEEAGGILAGDFFFQGDLWPIVDDMSGDERYRIVHDVIRPNLMRSLPYQDDLKHEDELTIHFRSGDIFKDVATASGYTQPPLSFYTLIVRALLRDRLITRVRLVFEDRENPCIDRFIAFADRADIPYRLQSGSVAEDLNALIDAPKVVYGYGTFGVAACLLSKSIGTLFFFEPLNYQDYDGIPSIGRTIFVRDRDARYMKPGDWSNTPEQRELMLNYPESALEILGPDHAWSRHSGQSQK